MITIDSLTVRYGRCKALDAVTAHFTEGAVHALVGGPGAGKTTLLDTLAGLVAPAAGSVSRFGRPLRRCDIARVEQRVAGYEGLTGRDLLELAARYRPDGDPAACAGLFTLPLDCPFDRWPAPRQKALALCLALAQRTPVVLLDEPFEGFDAADLRTAQRLVLRRQAEGTTFLVAARDLRLVADIADDIRLVDGGRLVGSYRREEFGKALAAFETLRCKKTASFS